MPIDSVNLYLSENDKNKLIPSLEYLKQELNIEIVNLKSINNLSCIFKPHRGLIGRFYKKQAKGIYKKLLKLKVR